MLLYPPTIEGQLPPAVLWKDDNLNEIIIFTIPYQVNRGVNPSSISKFKVKIRNLISDQFLAEFTIPISDNISDTINFKVIEEGKTPPDDLLGVCVEGSLKNNINLGDHLKIQVAFVDNNEVVGYYSTVGVCKYIATPGLTLQQVNDSWCGYYINDQLDELLYSSQFILKDEYENVLEESEIEIVRYESEDQDSLFQTYFGDYIKPSLNTEVLNAQRRYEAGENWKPQQKCVKLASLTNKPKKDNDENNNAISQTKLATTAVAEFKNYIKDIKKQFAEKESGKISNYYTINKLITDINIFWQGDGDNSTDNPGLAEEIATINSYTEYSQEKYEFVQSTIDTLNKMLETYKLAFETHKAVLLSQYNYWTLAQANGFEEYYKAMTKTGKIIFHDFNYNLKPGYPYKVQWNIETSSGYQANIPETFTEYGGTLLPDFSLIPKVRNNNLNGMMEISVIKKLTESEYEITTNEEGKEIKKIAEKMEDKNYGHWKILKSSSKDGFSTWTELLDIPNFYTWHLSYNINPFENIVIKDYDVEQGVGYQYALQQINPYGIKSMKISTETVISSFEDMYLCDENRQLRIAFNPKVSSMKNTVLESKQDTIGGKFPYFFRNGSVSYKEFSISGMISYLEDPDNEFHIDFKNLKDVQTINLSNDNFAKERLFKLEVLNWLNNGKPKLLKTAAEGNYVVRLMNVSLSPTDTLGRMIHTFNATAIEVNETESVVRASLNEIKNKSIHVSTLQQNDKMSKDDFDIDSIWVYGVGTVADEKTVEVKINNEIVQIGWGGLRRESHPNKPITSIEITGKTVADVYYTVTPPFIKGDFSKVREVKVYDVIGKVDKNSSDEELGELQKALYYKELTIYYNPISHDGESVPNYDAATQPGDSPFNPEDENRQVTLTYLNGKTETLSIIDSLQLSDITLSGISFGSDLMIFYCYNYSEIKEEG